MERRNFITLLGGAVCLSACSALPAAGPQARAIMSDATVASKSDLNAFKYAIVDLSQKVLTALSDPGPGSLYRSFGKGRAGRPELTVGIGDTVQITIFESSAGGLFIPSDAGSRPGNFITLPAQTVDQKGYVTVPYAGLILARGRTLPDIQDEIVRKLSGRAIEPQVVAAVTAQASN